jgi:hypothetical protein
MNSIRQLPVGLGEAPVVLEGNPPPVDLFRAPPRLRRDLVASSR